MNIENIKELRELKRQKEEIEDKENQMTTPVVTDLSLVKVIYGWFWEIMEERCCPPRRGSTMQRKKFLFIIIYLYCPRYFIGAKMPSGLRGVLSKLFGYNSPSAISDLCHSIVDQYLIYREIRRDVTDIIDKITVRLKNGGYI